GRRIVMQAAVFINRFLQPWLELQCCWRSIRAPRQSHDIVHDTVDALAVAIHDGEQFAIFGRPHCRFRELLSCLTDSAVRFATFMRDSGGQRILGRQSQMWVLSRVAPWLATDKLDGWG